MVRRLLLCLLLLAAPAGAVELYEGQAIVTGTGPGTRPDGLRACLAAVLAKVSGDPGLAEDPRVAAIDPLPLLRGLAYLDRMSGQPKHDEQGTRDRPFDLLARFDPAGVDAALHALGRRPWPLPRPDLLVEVEVSPRSGPPMPLRADTGEDEPHRAALLAAADRFGLRVLLPAATGPAPAPPPGAVPLSGALRWSDAAFGWVAEWRLPSGEAWTVSGVGFDEAYRAGVGGAARVLSGR